MASKTFKIVLAGDAKGATTAIKDTQKAGDDLVGASSGWSSKWSSVFGGMGGNLSNFGGQFSSFGQTAAVGVGVAAAAIAGLATVVAAKAQEAATYLYNLGEQFYNAEAIIRRGTGLTGGALEGMQDSLDVVYSQTARSSDDVAAAMVRVQQKLELQGKPLEDMTLKFLRLAGVTGGDVPTQIDAVTRAFGQWGIAAEDQGASIDMLMRAYQQSGVPLETLAQQTTTYGGALQGLGFTFEDSVSMLAQWTEDGINVDKTMAGMQKGFAEFATKHGPNAAKEFKKFTDRLAAAPDDATRAQIAIETLGKRGGAEFANSIGKGAFAYGDMLDAVANGKDTVEKAGKETGSWRASVTMMVHTLETKLRPAAEKVFGVINDVIRQNIMPLFRGLSTAWDEGGFVGVMEALPGVFGLVQIKLGEWWETFKAWLAEKWPDIMAGASAAISAAVSAGGSLMVALGDMLKAFGDWFQETAFPYIQAHWGEWWKSFTDSFNEGGFMNQAIMKLTEFLFGIGQWIVTDAVPWLMQKGWELSIALLKWIGTDGIPSAVAGLGSLFGAIVEWIETDAASWIADGARGMWNGIVNSFVSAINTIIDLWNQLQFTTPDLPGTEWGGQTVTTPDIGRIVQSSVTTQGTSSGAARRGDPLKGMANGAVVTGPTFALIGEDARTTPEIVTPEALMRQIVREEAGRGGGRQPIQLLLDRRVLAEVVVDVMNIHMKQAS